MAASSHSSSFPDLLLASSFSGRTSDILAGPPPVDSPPSGPFRGVGRFMRGLSNMPIPRSASDGSPLKSVARFNLKPAGLETGFAALASSATTVMAHEPRDEDAVLPRLDWARVQRGARIICPAGTEGQNHTPRGSSPDVLSSLRDGTLSQASRRHAILFPSQRHSYPELKDRMALPHTATGRRFLKAQQLGENA